MSYDPLTNTFTVSNETDLNQAIADIDAVGRGGQLGTGAYTIRLAQDITLGAAASGNVKDIDGTTDLQVNGGSVANSADLKAINLSDGTTVTIDGASHTLDGGGTTRGLFVYNGTVSIHDLTISNAVAQGGSGEGGGAGLGGGLFVAGTNSTAVVYPGLGTTPPTTPGGNVTLSNVTFLNDQARGGAGIGSINGSGIAGGGGLGGDGGTYGGGGVGLEATGAFGSPSSGTLEAGGAGIIVGAPSGASPVDVLGTQSYGSMSGRSGGGGGGGISLLGPTGGGGGVSGSAFTQGGNKSQVDLIDGGFGGGGAPEGQDGGTGGAGGFGGGGGYTSQSNKGFATGAVGGFGGGGGNYGIGGFGGGNGVDISGGGGLGAGGAIFVQAGGQLTIAGNYCISGGAVVAGTALSSASVGQAFGSGIYLQGDNQLNFSTSDPTTGEARFPTVSDVIADDQGSAAAASYGEKANYALGSVAVNVSGGGALTFSAVNTYSGTTTISGTAALIGGVSGALPAASAFVVDKGASLLLASNQTIASLADGSNGGGTVSAFLASAPPTLTLAGSANTSFSGMLEDQTGFFGQQSLTLVKQGAGTQTLMGANTYSGGTTLSGGVLNLAVANVAGKSGGAGTGAITFAGTSISPATLMLGTAAQPAVGGTFGNVLDNFGDDDSLDLEGFTYSTGDSATVSDNTLTFTDASGKTERFTLGGTKAAAYYVHDAGANGVIVNDEMACFASGTQIRITQGHDAVDVEVERLHVGDQVFITSVEARPIRWVGHRTVNCRSHSRPAEAMPVRISAHAFGPNQPARDLFVSPGHAICVDVVGEVLIPAGLLVNGSTIQQIEVDEVTYWHVELEGGHNVILAENLPAESYLDMGNRGFFGEAPVVDLAAGPDAELAQRTHADFCRPFVDDGTVLDAVRTQLRRRAEAIGWRSTDALEMHLVVDGKRLDPVVRGLTARFHLPADAKEVWLMSPTARPRDTMGADDGRHLGLYISCLRIGDGFEVRNVAIDDPLLCIGFHDVEDGARRWTAGCARLPAALWEGCDGDFYLMINFAGRPVPRWIASTDTARAVTTATIAA